MTERDIYMEIVSELERLHRNNFDARRVRLPENDYNNLLSDINSVAIRKDSGDFEVGEAKIVGVDVERDFDIEEMVIEIDTGSND